LFYLERSKITMSTIIAIPSENPGGLDAGMGAHFGHCDLYTLVTVDNGQVADVKVIPNVPHQQGGCMAPVQHLADSGVKQLIAGGMGLRPLMGFNQVGIEVYFSNGARTVGEAVSAMLDGRLPQFQQEHTCGGGGGH
jgi:predicted Fe-Mo cluster-binding NifX family protein